MVETLKTVLGTLLLLFQSRSRLQVEILALRQQLIVLRRTAPKRVRLRAADRLLFVLLYRLWPGVLDSTAVSQPDTIVRWHRRGFRALWWWKSRRRLGRPGIAKDMRDLIREISRRQGRTPLWSQAEQRIARPDLSHLTKPDLPLSREDVHQCGCPYQ
jgi:hypothetical protein